MNVQCPAHDSLWSKSVRGELSAGDLSRVVAEIDRCEECAVALQAAKSQPVYSAVDMGVKSAIAEFKAPPRRRRLVSSGSWAMAAGLLLAAGVVFFSSRDLPLTQLTSVEGDLGNGGVATSHSSEIVAVEDFENSDMIFSSGLGTDMPMSEEVSTWSGDREQVELSSPSVFGDGLESGDTSRWKVVS